MQKKVMAQVLGLVLAGVFVTGAAQATDQKVTSAPETAVYVQGVQVAIDPATGHLVEPTAAQRTALSKAMAARAAIVAPRSIGTPAVPRNEAEAAATLHTIKLKNGRTAVGMALPENLMSSLVAERRADGSLSIHHQGDDNAAKTVEVTK
ncbi:MAG: hypothetical protein ABI114_04430 [Rhodanobacter sp.]